MKNTLEQPHTEQQDEASHDRFFDASGDAAFGMLPRYADPEYLRGYFHGLQSIPKNEQGQLIYAPQYINPTEI